MITEIGIAAGEILIILEEERKCSTDNLFQKLNLPHEVIYMAVGWLTRERYVMMNKNHNGYDILLRDFIGNKPE